MNKRQREVARVQLEDEEVVIKQIEKAYKKALTDINAKIRALQTDELTQSRIYQLQYQKALKSQINSILERMRDEQYTSIEEYLKDCYEKGYLGVMYDLQGQGIPMILPIDQRQVVNAIVNDVPLSESMYDHMGKTVSTLKKRVNSELSRGLSQAYSWTKIAQNIEHVSKIGYSNAVRIARTEGHRVQNQSTYDAMKKVQDKGVKVMKQWISTLDRKTRPDHQRLDGQVRELDEPFEVNGHKGMYPGAFGVAKEDINCRCRMVQTMERDMDEEELNTLKERAEYFGLDKSKDFEDFRKKWIDGVNQMKRGIDNIDDAKKRISELFPDVDIKKLDEMDENAFIEQVRTFDEIEEKFGVIKKTGCEFTIDNKAFHGGNGEGALGVTDVRFDKYGSIDRKATISINPKVYKDHERSAKTHRYNVGKHNIMDGLEEYDGGGFTVAHEYGHLFHDSLVQDEMKERHDKLVSMKKRLDELKEIQFSKTSTVKEKMDAMDEMWDIRDEYDRGIETYEDVYRKKDHELLVKNLDEITDIAKSLFWDDHKDDYPEFDDYHQIDISGQMSNYGKSSASEFFAEAFANSQCGKPNYIGKAMQKWLEKKVGVK